MSGDAGGWAAALCPTCRFVARIRHLPEHSLAVACDRCGEFDLSDGAEDVLHIHAGQLDRQRLSEAMRDVCLMADCERPMIDAITAGALIGLASLGA